MESRQQEQGFENIKWHTRKPETDSFLILLATEILKRVRNSYSRLSKRKAIAKQSQILAEAMSQFNKGNLDSAMMRFRQVRLDPYDSQIARKMLEWIGYLEGNLENGWPFYPVTSIDRVPIIEFLTGYFKFAFSRVVHVRKAARPWELKYLLKLKSWTPESQNHKGLLVWFNFGSSIGGEILCGKLLGKFLEQNANLNVTCALDPRLVDLFKDTYPDVGFISKKDALPVKGSQYDHFLLGKDLLGLLARKEEDFLDLRDKRVIPSGEKISLDNRKYGTKVAISWKTTNVEQGKYRNIPLHMLVKVLKRYPYDYFSAQHGATEAEKTYLAEELGSRIDFELFAPSGSLNDFCLRLLNMDLVLSIDNSTMHMAGAIGVKTIGLLSIPSYWAYPASGEDSRWYDSVSLIRQSAAGDWSTVVLALDQKLESLL